MKPSILRIVSIALVAMLVLALGWAGFAPIHALSREVLFEIPRGTFARRMAGNKVEILPSRIVLTQGVRDVLLLRNLDDVPQVFGPSIMMSGQSLRLPFERAAEYQFACTAHASGQMTIVVEPEPRWPWQKIAYRIREWSENR